MNPPDAAYQVRGDSPLRKGQALRVQARSALDDFLHWRVQVDPWDLHAFLAAQPSPERAPDGFEDIVSATVCITPRAGGSRALEWWIGCEGSRILYVRFNPAHLPEGERLSALSAWTVHLERIGKAFNADEIGVTVAHEAAEVRLWWD